MKATYRVGGMSCSGCVAAVRSNASVEEAGFKFEG